jgi:hypothetical protein
MAHQTNNNIAAPRYLTAGCQHGSGDECGINKLSNYPWDWPQAKFEVDNMEVHSQKDDHNVEDSDQSQNNKHARQKHSKRRGPQKKRFAIEAVHRVNNTAA